MAAASQSGIAVLEIAPAEYRPGAEYPPSATEASACQAWSLDKAQAEAFFNLSMPLAEGELHDFSWLPCSIKGRLQAGGQEWVFEINAAGTSTWTAAGLTRLLGCAEASCEPFLLLMPAGLQD